MSRAGQLLGAQYQAVVETPVFSIGVRCDDDEVVAIEYLRPRPDLAPTNRLAVDVVRQLRAYLADSAFSFGLPLRPSGTFFQRRVWAEILVIPAGETRTYGELAKNLRNAPRAVGQACGVNPFPLAVPCHRVIAAGGALGGFGGRGHDGEGAFLLDIKRWLLAHEQR